MWIQNKRSQYSETGVRQCQRTLLIRTLEVKIVYKANNIHATQTDPMLMLIFADLFISCNSSFMPVKVTLSFLCHNYWLLLKGQVKITQNLICPIYLKLYMLYAESKWQKFFFALFIECDTSLTLGQSLPEFYHLSKTIWIKINNLSCMI